MAQSEALLVPYMPCVAILLSSDCIESPQTFSALYVLYLTWCMYISSSSFEPEMPDKPQGAH